MSNRRRRTSHEHRGKHLRRRGGMAIFGEGLPRSPILTFFRILGFALVLLGSWILAVGPAGTNAVTSGP